MAICFPAIFPATIQFGGYINPFKAVTVILVLLVWARLLTWMDKDATPCHLPRLPLNCGMLGGLALGYGLFFFMPNFWIGLGVLFLFFAADLGTYIGLRARRVGLSDLKDQFEDFRKNIFKKKTVDQVIETTVGRVVLMSRKGAVQTPPDKEALEEVSVFEAVQTLLHRPLQLGFERLELTPGDTAKTVFTVDGFAYAGEALSGHRADTAIQYLKTLADLDLQERRKPQKGTFRASLDTKRFEIQITTFGSTAGESLRLITNPQERQNFKLEALGFSETQLETLRESSKQKGGIVLLAAPRGQGLSSLAYAVIRHHDAYLNHVHTLERAPEQDLEGITQNVLSAGASASDEAKQFDWIVAQEPDVVMVPLIEDPRTAAALCKFADTSRRAYVGLRASGSIDALRAWRKLVGDDATAVKNLKMVIAGRIFRRLCMACKVAYTPDPAQLRKLNMNPSSVGNLYFARKEPMRDAKGKPIPCTFCNDLAFAGRFGVYEIFVLDDDTRKLVADGATDVQLKQMFVKQRGQLLQDLALAHVQAGDTSVEEVLRVFKGETAVPAAPPDPLAELAAAVKTKSAPVRSNS